MKTMKRGDEEMAPIEKEHSAQGDEILGKKPSKVQTSTTVTGLT